MDFVHPTKMEAELDFPGSSTALMQLLLESCDDNLAGSVETSPPKAGSSVIIDSSSSNSTEVNEERPWVCEKCGFRFKYKNNMAEHMRFYHMKGSVPCNICSEVFATSTHLRMHRKAHSLEQGKCPHCRYNFPGCNQNPEKYREFYEKHLPECRRCPAKMILSKTENKSPTHDKDKKCYVWSCLACCQKFTDLTEYDVHECQGSQETDYTVDGCELANAQNQDISQESLPYSLSAVEIAFEPPVVSSNIDDNFLCIICGVNFEDEENLNLHLYESHQTCDHDAVRNYVKCPSLESNKENPVKPLVCQQCGKDFPEKCVLMKHEESCEPKADFHKQPNQTANEDTVKAIEPVTNSHADVTVPLVIEDNKKDLTNQCTTRPSENLISPSNEVPVPSSSDLKVFLSCKLCNTVFLDSKEVELHEEQCKRTFEANSSEVIVQWLCKYCKVAFSSKGEMRMHKEVCALEHKSSETRNVLIRWVCKYCKENFQTRESMCTHKSTCFLKNRDKSVISSTESDISEVASKEVGASRRRNSFVVDDDNNDHGRNKSGTRVTVTKHEVIGIQERARLSADDLYCGNETMKLGSGESNISLLGDYKSSKNVGILFPISDQDESVLVKWVCRYCKEDFVDRESMCEHKRACKLKQKDRSLLHSAESDSSSILYSGRSLAEEEGYVHLNINGKRTAGNVEYKLAKRKKMTKACEDCTKTNSEVKVMSPHICKICGKKFYGRAAMKAHKLECHMFKCSKCGRYFENNSNLWKHARLCRVQKLSNNIKKKVVFTCKKCYRVFRERYKYNLHKLSCQHELIRSTKVKENLKVILPGKNLLLRIQCSKCTGSYVGREIFSLHTCEDPRASVVFMGCKCGLTGFHNIPTFYNHFLKCSTSNLDHTRSKTKYFSSKSQIHILCSPCGLKFSKVFLYYLHLLSHPLCRETNAKIDLIESPTYVIENNSVLRTEVLSEDDSRDWTCSFCKFIISSSIPKNMHYQMCHTKVCHKCGFFGSRTKTLFKHSCSEGLKYMASAKVVLQRFSLESLLGDSSRRQLRSVRPISVSAARQARVQRCVICYKKCKFEGVGLPPIGQLECFQCRSKMHRKELKKRGETFFSRNVFDAEMSQTGSPFEEQTQYLPSYLDPTKRLQMSRALSKGKQLCQENLSEILLTGREQQPEKMILSSSTSTTPCTNKVLEKCSHCKRGFSSKAQLEKHVKVSKTCMSDIRNASIINFVDFLTNSSRVALLKNSDRATSSEENESTSSLSITLNNNSSNSSIQNDTASNSYPGSLGHCDESENGTSILSSILTDSFNVRCNTNQTATKPSYLLFDRIEKVLSSHKLLHRVPVSPALQCDGWILRSNQNDESDSFAKSKYICGACFKSFSTSSAFSEHAELVHQLPASFGARLNVMKHIPNEMLDKLSW